MATELELVLLGISLLAVFIGLVLLIKLRFFTKNQNYVIQLNGHSAKLNKYPLSLLDSRGSRIWIKKVDKEVWVETIHDTITVEKRTGIWVYDHHLTFTYEGEDTIVHWNRHRLSIVP